MRRSALIVASCRQLLRAAESSGAEALAAHGLAAGSAASCPRILTCTADAALAAAGRRSLHRWAHPQLPGQRSAVKREVWPDCAVMCNMLLAEAHQNRTLLYFTEQADECCFCYADGHAVVPVVAQTVLHTSSQARSVCRACKCVTASQSGLMTQRTAQTSYLQAGRGSIRRARADGQMGSRGLQVCLEPCNYWLRGSSGSGCCCASRT
jgi:hypothetical protein